ncbi:MAG TPA: ATP-binding protein [Chlamydiales bacterium]|nr:ATP-binding protein [Chlamydiales bacterium]
MKNEFHLSPPSVNKIVGREKELGILKGIIQSTKAEFVAIYGRRRVGKTYLVKKFADSTTLPFFHVTGIQKGSLQEQLEEFAKQIGSIFYQGAAIVPRKRWRDAFSDLTQAIAQIPKNKKVVLFFDELPWMATPRSGLLKALELYWNRYWVFDDRIKLIVCGSATSWIIEHIINDRGGLHNRVTRTIQLKPFSLNETKQFLAAQHIHLENKQILDLYTAFGGVPLYWSFIRKGLSAHQCIDEICFQNNGALVKEFGRLFSSLFEDPKLYTDIIKVIARHRYGIGQSELIVQAKLPPGGNTVYRFSQLEEAGFITSLVPYGHKDKGIYYVIDDEYSLFYLQWIAPNMKTIAKKAENQGFWNALSQRPSWKSWSGLAFESICYKHIDQIRIALKLDPGSIAGTWRYKPRMKTDSEGAQIDLLFDRPDGSITICEIKCSDSPFLIDKSCAQALLNKMEIFRKQTRTKKQLFLAMITPFGLHPTMYSEEIVTNQVVLEDLFKEIS